MRLAVFRAEQDGRRTAARLAERGHEAVLAPVIRILSTGAAVEAGDAGAVVFTSQHAVEALASADQRVRDLPCYCVGGRTSAAARAAGFQPTGSGASDARSLATMIISRCPSGTPILFIAGQDRKPELEAALSRGGFPVRVVETYAAEPIAAWSSETVEAIARCHGALHYSARTAELACILCESAGLGSSLDVWTHYCLSNDVAETFRMRAVPAVRIAPTPKETALLGLL